MGTLTGLTRCRLVHLCFCHRLVKEARFSQRETIRSSSTATKSISYTKVEQAKGPKSLAVPEALQLFRLFRYVADADCIFTCNLLTLHALWQKGIIHHTRTALSPVGQQQDIHVASELYAEEWWLEQLARRNRTAIWARSESPHNYEITAVEAYMDLFEMTGDQKYVDAVDGFYDMFASDWLHVGGTVAIKENKLYPPGSYFLDSTGPTSWVAHNGAGQNCSRDFRVPDRQCGPGDAAAVCEGCTHSTGETCGQAFWIKLSQRLHRLRPTNETYVRLRSLISKVAQKRGLPLRSV